MKFENSLVDIRSQSRIAASSGVLLLALLAALVAQNGCGPASGSGIKITNAKADNTAQWSEDLFTFALENLNHLEDNDCDEMWRSTKMRWDALQQPKPWPAVVPSDALLASWPEPDMLRQVVSRLNQWVDTQEKPAVWTPDPMLATLPAGFARLPMLQNLDQAHFTSYDGYMLMEAVWLRDAAKWGGGGSADELLVARSLFDWTLRNIQIDYDSPSRVPQVPWETLFLGHGTAWERAWTYILLLRQRGIDAAVLALPDEASSPEGKADKSPPSQPGKQSLKPWCIAVLLGDKEKKQYLYLFDPKMGLPIPAPHGIRADKSGQLDVEPATLDQVVADPTLLSAMSLGDDASYWAQKTDLKRAVALLDASPIYLSPRTKRIESHLTGEQRMVLTTEPSKQAALFKAAGVGDVRLWELPYTTLERREALEPKDIIERLLAYVPFMSRPGAPLYKGRILHLKGKLFNEREAVAYYQRARPRYSTIGEEAMEKQKEFYEAQCKFQEAAGRKITPELENYMKRDSIEQAQQFGFLTTQGKLAASYWLGLIQYDGKKYAAAFDYLRIRTLQFGDRNVFWATGAHYNIARTLEAAGERQKAIDYYETNLFLRIDNGNLVRARWLRELAGGSGLKPAEKKAEEKKTEQSKLTEKQPDVKKPETPKVDEKKPEEKKPDMKQPAELKTGEKKIEEKKMETKIEEGKVEVKKADE